MLHTLGQPNTASRPLAGAAEHMVRMLGPVSYFLAIPLLYHVRMLAPLALAATLPLVLLAAGLTRPAAAGARVTALNRVTVIAVIAADLGMIAWGAAASSSASADVIWVLALTIGLGSGIFGMLAAHEMIHSRDRAENAIGGVMLTGMTYRHFRISHLTGHHRWAATPRDPVTARRGESAYAFLARSITCQVADVWRSERRRHARGGRFWRNRLLQDLAVYSTVYGAAFAALGWRAAVFLAVHGAVSIIVLEMFNYVAHYGLMRPPSETGRPSPIADAHSWNAGGGLANWLFLNMGHHSDHHRHPSQDYGRLEPIDDTPMLPGGYAGAILLALAPPLWRRVMDPKVERIMRR